MEKITLNYVSKHLQDILNNPTPKVYYVIHEETEINTGQQNDYNEEYCQKYSIPIYKMNREGGTIVCSAGNIGVSTILPVKYGWQCSKFIKAFVKYLKSFDLNVSANNNDILIDGYKVTSCAEIRVGDNLKNIYSTFQFNIYQDIETIKQVCKKEMVKIPKALSDYGFNTESIFEFVKNYFENLEKNFVN